MPRLRGRRHPRQPPGDGPVNGEPAPAADVTIDALRSTLALVRAAIEGDGTAVDAVLAGGDVRAAIISLCSYAAQVTIAARHGRQPALEWIASTQQQLLQAERQAR